MTITSKPATEEFRDGHDRIFGKKMREDSTPKNQGEFFVERVERFSFLTSPMPKTCDGCKHFSFYKDKNPNITWGGKIPEHGECDWLGGRCDESDPLDSGVGVDGFASIHVGPKFGCLKWSAK